MDTPKYLTVKEAAQLLRLDERTVRNKMSKGDFKRGKHYIRNEGRIGIRFKQEALIAWMEGTDEPKPPAKSSELLEDDDGVVIPMARGRYNLGR